MYRSKLENMKDGFPVVYFIGEDSMKFSSIYFSEITKGLCIGLGFEKNYLNPIHEE